MAATGSPGGCGPGEGASRGAGPSRAREGAARQKRLYSVRGGRQFVRREQSGQLVAEGAGQTFPQSLEDCPLVVIESLTAPPPQNSSEFWLNGEAEAIVATLDSPVGEWQQVPALPIGVVENRVQDGHPPQGRVVGRDQLAHVHGLVHFHPELNHPLAERTVAHSRRRDQVPAARFRQQVCSDFATGQGSVWEVVERLLASDRLVDAGGGPPWGG